MGSINDFGSSAPIRILDETISEWSTPPIKTKAKKLPTPRISINEFDKVSVSRNTYRIINQAPSFLSQFELDVKKYDKKFLNGQKRSLEDKYKFFYGPYQQSLVSQVDKIGLSPITFPKIDSVYNSPVLNNKMPKEDLFMKFNGELPRNNINLEYEPVYSKEIQNTIEDE